MIDLSKKDRSRQKSVWVDGEEYPIHTDFYYWIAFGKYFETLQAGGEFPLSDLDYLYNTLDTSDGKRYGIPENRKAGYEELWKFYANEQPLPHPLKESNVKAIDWNIDSEYIYAAFLQQYGINLIKDDLHWHDFLSFFSALHDTKINEIISARYIKDEKGTTKGMKEIRDAWRLDTLETGKPVFKMR